jgi:hypothetical protein
VPSERGGRDGADDIGVARGGSVAGDRTLTEEEFKVQVRQAIEAERAEVHAPPEADRPARK